MARKKEVDGDKVWSIINTTTDKASEAFMCFTDKEVKFLKLILKALVRAQSLSYEDVYKLRSKNGVVLTPTEAADALRVWIKQGWLDRVGDTVYIGARSHMGLSMYMSALPGAGACTVCRRLCVFGLGCSDECECAGQTSRVHLHCAEELFRDRDTRECPNDGCDGSVLM